MSIAQLRAFHLVAVCGGFSQAAREMAASQSTLSGQVRQLEAASQVSLFERQPRGVMLTPEGQALYEITSRLFAAEAEARAFLRGDVLREGGHLRVAADGPFLPLPILAALERARPKLTFSLSVNNSDRVIDMLLNFRSDVGITARQTDDPRLFSQHIATMGLGLCVPRDHELAQRTRVAMATLEGLRFVMRESGSLTREVFERNLADHGVVLGPVLEVSSREGVNEAVAAGFGAAVVASGEFSQDPRLSFIPIEDARHYIQEYAICLADRRHLPLVRAFFEQAVEWGRSATAEGNLAGTPTVLRNASAFAPERPHLPDRPV